MSNPPPTRTASPNYTIRYFHRHRHNSSTRKPMVWYNYVRPHLRASPLSSPLHHCLSHPLRWWSPPCTIRQESSAWRALRLTC